MECDERDQVMRKIYNKSSCGGSEGHMGGEAIGGENEHRPSSKLRSMPFFSFLLIGCLTHIAFMCVHGGILLCLRRIKGSVSLHG